MERLRKRTDFLATASGAKAAAAAFVLQARRRDDDGPPRVGFTVSRQLGTAVQRNRARRRLKEVVRLAGPGRIRPGHDYVVIGRPGALILPFALLLEEFKRAIERIHRGGRVKSAERRGRVQTERR
jgi:ribonuclease P protein component